MNKPSTRSKLKKQPWPTKAAMEQVYEMKLWGGNDSLFYSGTGSHDPEIVEPYIKAVVKFLNSFQSKLIVCDLGCGDFNVGKEIVQHTKSYIAADIVKDLIEYNKLKYKINNSTFVCLDIAVDVLPAGDCVILRQVLQHLSNNEIKQVIPKLKQYKYLILTEHLPQNDFVANLDIISGQGTRLKKNSGVVLSLAPFNFNAEEEQVLLNIKLGDGKGCIVTTLFTI